MPYLGNPAQQRFSSPRAASVYSGDGSTVAFTLEEVVTTDEDILVSVDGVIQEPSVAYAVSSGTTLTFTAAPSSNSGNNIFVYYIARTFGSVSMPDGQNVNAAVGSFSGTLTTTGAFTSIGIDDNADATAITIDSSENVGIGETSSLGKLHVKSGDSGASSVSGNANELVVENSDYTGITILGEDEASIMFGDNEDPDVGRIVYFHGTNTMSFMTNTNNAMHIDSIGAITKPLQPAFLAIPSSTQSNIATNATTTVVFGTEVYDQNADFASNTFTAPVTGKYFLGVSLYLQEVDVDATYVQVDIATSNRNYFELQDLDYTGDRAYLPVNIGIVADMDANDTAFVRYSQSGGAAQTDINNDSRFMGYLLG